jgi:hypothetical protein
MKQATAPFVLALLVAVGGPGAGVGFAQIGYGPPSIEWLTASSDVVVRASVADLGFKDRAPKAGETESQWQWVTVTLTVRATLKGKAPETIVFVIEQVRGVETLPRWKESGQAVLWFLVDIGDRKEEIPRDFPGPPQGRLRLRELGAKFLGTAAVELASPKAGKRVPSPVFSMDFQVLDDEDKILEAVKAEAARQQKGEVSAIRLSMPRKVAARSGRSGDVNVLYVPVNDRLEQLALDWVRSKEDWLRQAGVRALGPFKSEANAAVLRGMMDDPAWWVEEKDNLKERVYYIREAAYKTLREWELPVTRPVLREPLKEK